MKGLRIGRRRARAHDQQLSPLELALRPALVDERWTVPDRFNFARDVVEALAADPKRQALTFIGDDGVIEPRTFLEIAEGAARWSVLLSERGVEAKDRLLVIAGSSVQWLEIVLGAMKLGAVTVPCRPGLSAASLEARVSSTEASLVVAEHDCEAAIEQMSFTPEVQYIDPSTAKRSSDSPKHAPTHDTSSRDAAFVFTSAGATGRPKELVHTHASIFAARVQAEHWLEAGRGDVVWCTAEADAPLYAWLTLVGPWSCGAEIVLQRGEFDAKERLEHLYRLGATILCQTPAEYRALAELPRLERFRSPRLRRLVSTGDFLEPEVREAFRERWGLTIHDGYGQAETGVFIAGGDHGDEETPTPGAIGRPLPGYQVAIVDDQGNELPEGIEGDLAIRGNPPTLFAGYWEAPDETKRAFRGDWYLTGDVALLDHEGTFVFVGRAEDIITSSGRTFGPYGVEHVLRSHPAVAASAVVGIRDLQRGGHFVRAFVVPAPKAEGSEQLQAELRQHVSEVLPEQQVPREIVFVEALPVVAGKLSRSTLREQPISGRPLWDLPPTSEPEVAETPAAPKPKAPVPEPKAASEAPTVAKEPEPVVVAPAPAPVSEPEPVAAVEAEPVAVFEPEPVAAVEAEPVVAESAPVPVAEVVEPVAVVEPEPAAVAEPVAVVEPEPVAVVEPEPVVVEPEPAAVVEPEPVAEPVALVEPASAVEPEPVAAPEPELEPPAATVVQVPQPREPEPESATVAEAAPAPAKEPEPQPTPRATAAEAPAPTDEVPKQARESEPEQEAERAPEFRIVAVPDPEAVAPSESHAERHKPAAAETFERESEPEPLPDFVVPPGAEPARVPVPEPEPEPDLELEPLPDYIVDPSRPAPERVEEDERRQAAEVPPPSFPGLIRPVEPAPEPTAAEAAGIYFPPVTSFPPPREDDEAATNGPREPRKAPRRRSTAEPGTSKRKRSLEEPGDDAGDGTWMAGLSNRLSAYSLAEDGAEEGAEDPDGDGHAGDPGET